VLVLGGIALLPILGHAILRVVLGGKHRPFVELAYGYLPLVLGGSLAHYLRLGMTEAGRVLPVTAATFGMTNLDWPSYSAHPAVIAFLQSTTLVFSLLLTWILTQKIARQSFWSLLPQHLTSAGLGLCLWQVIVRI
jgi:hypothetical protein